MSTLIDHTDDFILYLATERGLSDNYQLSVRASLEGFADWAKKKRRLEDPAKVTIDDLTAYLATRKADGLATSSIRLIIMAMKIFFRWLVSRNHIPKDVADAVLSPRLEKYLPETLNEPQFARPPRIRQRPKIPSTSATAPSSNSSTPPASAPRNSPAPS